MPVPRTPPPVPKADPEYASLLNRLHYLPEAHTDVTTRYVLNEILADKQSKVPTIKSLRANKTLPVACHAAMSKCAKSGQGGKSREPILLIVVMPWFAVHTGHIRTWTLLHRFKYPCLFKQLNMKMLVLVQPGELEGCKRICPDVPMYAEFCRCAVAEHDRAFQHRNLQNYTDGSASVLYAHADTWINLCAYIRGRLRTRSSTSCRVCIPSPARARALVLIVSVLAFATWSIAVRTLHSPRVLASKAPHTRRRNPSASGRARSSPKRASGSGTSSRSPSASPPTHL